MIQRKALKMVVDYPEKALAEQRLWWAVLHRAIFDYAEIDSRPEHKTSAKVFLFDASHEKWLAEVSRMAGTQVEYVRKMATMWADTEYRHCFFCLRKTKQYHKRCLVCQMVQR